MVGIGERVDECGLQRTDVFEQCKKIGVVFFPGRCWGFGKMLCVRIIGAEADVDLDGKEEKLDGGVVWERGAGSE